MGIALMGFRLGCSAMVLSLFACATRPATDVASASPWGQSPWGVQSGVVDATSGAVLPASDDSHWVHYTLPGKTPTEFSAVQVDGRDAMAVTAVSSASMLRRKVQVDARKLGSVRFSWSVPALIDTADMGHRDYDDSPVRVVFAFDGDRSQFSAKNALLNELTRALTGDEMPYAVLMYVWSKQRPVGEIIHSPRTDRIRKLVIESGGEKLGQWQMYERDIAADFQTLYGEPPGALMGIGIMTDTDNTRTTAQAWYGPLQVLTQRPPSRPVP